MRGSEERRLERSDSSIPPTTITNNLPFVASLLVGYGPIRDAIGAKDKNAPFYLKFAAGSLSGSIGSVVGNPFDVMKTMMMANSKAEGGPGLGTLMSKMYADQGIGGFFRGIEANILRACVLNGTKMACYDLIKGKVNEQTGWDRRDPRCQVRLDTPGAALYNTLTPPTLRSSHRSSQFMSAIGAGFFMTCTVSPFDNMRTLLMNQPTDAKVYNGFADCFVKTVKKDGPFALYRGFFPIWGRFAPQATLQLVIMDTALNFFGFDTI